MNDQTYVEAVKKALLDCIAELDSIKWLYLTNPDKDFTHNRKITFEKFINICLQMDGGALQNELMKHFDFAEGTPTKSAFCQQRAKVSPEALKFLFCIFTEMLMGIDAPKTFKGYSPVTALISISRTILKTQSHIIRMQTSVAITSCISMLSLIFLTASILTAFLSLTVKAMKGRRSTR